MLLAWHLEVQPVSLERLRFKLNRKRQTSDSSWEFLRIENEQIIRFQGIAYKLWAEHEFPLLKDFTDTSVDQAPQEPLFTFEHTELLFKNLDTAVLCLPTNKTKSLKKRKADQPGTCTERFDHAVPTDLKTKPDIGEDNMASCATPRPLKRRNSLNSLLTPRQSNSIATLKESAKSKRMWQNLETQMIITSRNKYSHKKTKSHKWETQPE